MSRSLLFAKGAEVKNGCRWRFMGLLKENKVLSWDETVRGKYEIRRKAAEQFVDAYRLYKDIHVPDFAFGEEIELMMIGRSEGRWILVLGSDTVVEDLNDPGVTVEYARYMLEISPDVPHDSESYLDVEEKILEKISRLSSCLRERGIDGHILMLSVFPNMCERFLCRRLVGGGCIGRFGYETTGSSFFPDEGITSHSRFELFTQNIRKRRGKDIEGYVKTMKDPDGDAQELPEYVRIDSMGQGMGCCCLQVTVQASSLYEGRVVYDMLGVLCPILLRITAGSPIAQGRLLNTETRWDMLCMSVDCRTSGERGSEFDVSGCGSAKKPLGPCVLKSRFSSIDLYISDDEMNLREYNDLFSPLEKVSYDKLIEDGVDWRMAEHVASLLMRDPILSYEADDDSPSDFENIQSSNWRSMRFKFPDKNAGRSHGGFRVETRVMEVQATAFENTAFIYFNFLLSRAIAEYKCNFYIPLSLVDENFLRANALVRNKEEYFSRLSEDRQRFYYRTNIFDRGPPVIEEGTVNEIMNGGRSFCGIIGVVRNVIRERFGDNRKLHTYIDFIEGRSKGHFMTLSDWIRRFVFTHKSYRNDSVVGDDIVDDLLDRLKTVSTENMPDYLLNS